MKGDLNINFSKVGLDEDSRKLAESYIEASKHPTKKIFRVEIDEDSRKVVKNITVVSVIGIIALTAVSIFKIIYREEA